jgi:hypothetical protein
MHVGWAIDALAKVDVRASTLIIGDSHCRPVNGRSLANSVFVVRVGGLCLPALARALVETEVMGTIKRVFVAVGTNDLLHHRGPDYDHFSDMCEVQNALKNVFPAADLCFIDPFNSPALRQARAPLEEFTAALRRLRGVRCVDNIDTRGLEFDERRLHLYGASHEAFVDRLREIVGGRPRARPVVASVPQLSQDMMRQLLSAVCAGQLR